MIPTKNIIKSVIIALQFNVIQMLNPEILNEALLPRHTILNFTSLATKYGHPPQQYEVITEDGYILTLYRLPGRSHCPVFLVHGLMDSADTWVLRGDKSLSITLANEGYDVWLANFRGNRYSRRHIFLNPDKDADFWKFSFHEMGYYDLPAFIDRTLKETGASSLSLIGHSQGTTASYVLGSTRPEYNEKINVMVSLSPVCYLHHSPPPISTVIQNIFLIEKLFTELNINEFLGDNTTAGRILQIVCPTPVIGYAICINGIIFPFFGYDPTELEPNFYQTNGAIHFPAGTSSRSVIHYLQVGYRQVFAPFDNGPFGNDTLYNSTTPSPYDLNKVTMPIALLAAKNDFLSMIPDVTLLKKQLPNVVFYLLNPRVLFNHVDAVWGRQMRVYLFPYIFQMLQRYNGLN